MRIPFVGNSVAMIPLTWGIKTEKVIIKLKYPGKLLLLQDR